jgi:post-segregation antitoxin (ccd killing protein)
MPRELIESAKNMKLNMSDIAQAAIQDAVRRQSHEEWRRENEKALKAHRERVKVHGALLDGLRRF